LGHLAVLKVVKSLTVEGFKPIVLVGGATTNVGDPSFRENLRDKYQDSFVDEFKANCKTVLGKLGLTTDVDLQDNASWLENIKLVDFLLECGSKVRIMEMLKKDSMQKRLQNGLRFSELTYQILQAYDFLFLHRTRNCCMQIGGADQWGNISAGLSLIKDLTGRELFGLAIKTIDGKAGTKLSKTGDALWITGKKASPILLARMEDHLSEESQKMMSFLFGDNYSQSIVRLLFGEHAMSAVEDLQHDTVNLHGLAASQVLSLSSEEFKGCRAYEIVCRLKAEESKNSIRRSMCQGIYTLDGVITDNPLKRISEMTHKNHILVKERDQIIGVVVRP
jgi:tyrosyl-tRNA synthetase